MESKGKKTAMPIGTIHKQCLVGFGFFFSSFIEYFDSDTHTKCEMYFANSPIVDQILNFNAGVKWRRILLWYLQRETRDWRKNLLNSDSTTLERLSKSLSLHTSPINNQKFKTTYSTSSFTTATEKRHIPSHVIYKHNDLSAVIPAKPLTWSESKINSKIQFSFVLSNYRQIIQMMFINILCRLLHYF